MPTTPALTSAPTPSHGTIKINREGDILWADDDAIALLHLTKSQLTKSQLTAAQAAGSETPDSEIDSLGNIQSALSLEGGKPLSEHLRLTLEAASYSTRGSSAIIRPHHDPERSLQLCLWADEDHPDHLICHLAHIISPQAAKGLHTDDLLTCLSDLQKDYIADKGSFYVFGRALDSLLQMTRSEYGFIGEILQDAQGKNFLKTHAITNIAWNEETRDFYQQNAPSGMEFYNHDTLFGYTVKSGRMLISNRPGDDSQAGGLPPGHPDLNTYLGLPIYSGAEFVGMAGIANREGGYDQKLAQYLAPLLNTLGMLLSAYRNEEKRRHVEAQLRSKAHELEQANRAKTHFFATMSHELRTPLNSILGFSTRLHKSLAEHLNERDELAFDAVIRNSKHLAALINDILDVSKMEAGKMEVLKEPLRFYQIIAEGIAAISGMADTYKVVVRDRVSPNVKHLKINGDEKRLLQVVLNLLSNAIKYGEGSDVEVGLEVLADRQLALKVEDCGPGISEAAQKNLFQQYASSAPESATPMEGTGLGLALVAEIIKLHDGRIWVDSEPGRGSRFYAALPLVD